MALKTPLTPTALLHQARAAKPAIVDGLNIPVNLVYVDSSGRTITRQFSNFTTLEGFLGQGPDVAEIVRVV